MAFPEQLLAEISALSAPIYFMFAMIIPLLIAMMIIRGYFVDRILVDRMLKKRLRWTVITLVLYLAFNETESLGVALGMEYGEFAIVRRPVGAIALIAGFILVDTLVPIIRRYEFSKRALAAIDIEKRRWQYVLSTLVVILLVSPLFPEGLALSSAFTAAIGVLLILNLYFILSFIHMARTRLTDMTNQEQLKWLAGGFIAMTASPFLNVVTILLGLPPSANLLRIPFTLVMLYCAYLASQYFIEMRRPTVRLPD